MNDKYSKAEECFNLPIPLVQIRFLIFTGTRKGMTREQYTTVTNFVKIIKTDWSVHGDCIGADGEFHDIVKEIKPSAMVEIYPSTFENMRANKIGDVIHLPMKALDRDKIMANQGEVLIAAPPTKDEIKASGSWATVRYSRKGKRMKMIIIVAPDGEFVIEDLTK